MGLKALTNAALLTHMSLLQALKANGVRVAIRHSLATREWQGLKPGERGISPLSRPVPQTRCQNLHKQKTTFLITD